MDFTDLSSFSNHQQTSKSKANHEVQSTFHDYSLNSIHSQYENILIDIKQINHNRSISKSFIDQEVQNSNIQLPLNDLNPKSELEYNFDKKQIKSITFRKSNIFQYLQTQITLTEQNSPPQNHIKIFYFNQPIHKFIQFSIKTTFSQLITLAIAQFINYQQFQQTSIISTNIQDYQLRFPQNQNTHLSDHHLQPIELDRVVSENLFETLVILLKQKKHRKPSFQNKSQNAQNQIQKFTLISLYNDIQEQLGSLNLSWYGDVSSVFSYVREHLTNFQNFILTENHQDQIPEDFQVRNLSSSKLYVKNKKFADESEEKQLIPVTTIKSCFKKSTENIIPISLTQASMYQEFEVIKVNSRGVKQQRILGVDQMKIYNYERLARKQKKQISLFSLIMGNHEETGTKTPYKLIKDIVRLTETKQGFKIQYREKTIAYIVEQNDKKERIVQKLQYLISYHQA